MNCIIKDENMSFTISTLGAELISAKNALDDEFIWNGDANYWGEQAPLLFPVCGRLKNFFYMYEGKRYDMGIHGFLRRLEFSLIESDDTHVVMTVSQNDQTLKEYPFNFTVTVSYTVENGKLLSTYSVKNDSDKLMPFAFGLHPGFRIFTDGGISVDDYKMVFNTTSSHRRTLIAEYPNGPEFLPCEFDLGEFKIDNGKIAHDGTIIFRNVGEAARLVCEKSSHEIGLEFSKNLPIFCIWKNPSPDANYVCLEPWSTQPALYIEVEELLTRKNMIHLAPGKSEDFFCNFTFKR